MAQYIGRIKLEIEYSTTLPTVWRQRCWEYWRDHVNDGWLRRVMSILNEEPADILRRQHPVSLALANHSSAFRDDLDDRVTWHVQAVVDVSETEQDPDYIAEQYFAAIQEGLAGWLSLMAASALCNGSVTVATTEWGMAGELAEQEAV